MIQCLSFPHIAKMAPKHFMNCDGIEEARQRPSLSYKQLVLDFLQATNCNLVPYPKGR